MPFNQLGIGAILKFATDAAIANVRAASETVGKLEKDFKRIGAGAAQVAGGVDKIASAMAPALLGAGAAAAGAVKKFADFDDAMAVVRTIWSESEEELQRLGGAMQELSIEFGRRTPEIAAGAYEALSASVPAKEMAQFTELAGKSAVGGLTNMRTAVDVLTTTVNTYGEALGQNATYTERAIKASDVLLKIQEKGKTTLDRLGLAMGFVLPAAQSLGVSLEDVAAAMATMTASGIRTSTAATSLRQVMATIAKPSKEAADAAEELGIEMGPAALQAKGLSGWLAELIDKTGGGTDALVKLFPSVEAFNAVAKLAAGGSEAFVANLAEMQDVVGTTEQTFAKRTDSIKFQAQRVFAALGVLAEKAGAAIVEEFGFKGIGGLADMIAEKMPEIVESIRDFVGGVREGFGAAMETLQPLWEGFRSVAESLGLIGDESEGSARTIGKLIGQFIGLAVPLAGAVMAAKPFLRILRGIGDVGFGAIKVVRGLAGVAGKLGAAGTTMAVGVGLGVAKLIDLRSEVPSLTENLEETLPRLSAVDQAMHGVAFATTVPAKMMQEDLSNAIDWVAERLPNIPPEVEKVSGAFEQMAQAVIGSMQQVTDAVVKTEVSVGNFVATQWELIKTNAILQAQREGAKTARLEALMAGPAAPRVGIGVSAAEVAALRAEQAQREAQERGQRRAFRAGRRCVEINNKLNLDGRNMSVATARARAEYLERQGGMVTPWQKTQINISGSQTTSSL